MSNASESIADLERFKVFFTVHHVPPAWSMLIFNLIYVVGPSVTRNIRWSKPPDMLASVVPYIVLPLALISGLVDFLENKALDLSPRLLTIAQNICIAIVCQLSFKLCFSFIVSYLVNNPIS